MICISLGNNTDLCIDNDNRLCVQQRNQNGIPISHIDLGLATEPRIENIQDYLGRLYVHAVPQEKKVA